MAWEEINQDTPLYVGDQVRLEFQTLVQQTITAATLAIIDKKLESDKRFKVLRHSVPQEGAFYYEIEVVATQQTEEEVYGAKWPTTPHLIPAAGYVIARTILLYIGEACLAAGLFGLACTSAWRWVKEQAAEFEEKIKESPVAQLTFGAAILIAIAYAVKMFRGS